MPVIMFILIKSNAMYVPLYIPIVGCLIGAGLALLLHFYANKSTT
jgi:hypothetical protein